MPQPRVSLGLAFALAAVVVPCRAQTTAPTKARIAWETDFDAALARAQKETKPVLVAFVMDNEPANDETINKHYTDAEFIKLTDKFVCLVCCVGEHKGEGGCGKFAGLTCAQHQAIEKKARARWLNATEDVSCPQHFFCDPDGKVVTRKIWFQSKEILTRCLVHTLAVVSKDPAALQLVEAEKTKVDKWLKDVDSRNADERSAAMRELVTSEDPRAMPAVIRVAKTGKDDVVRISAISALAQKGNFKAVDALGAMLTEGSAMIVIAAARSLETIQLHSSTPSVLGALKKEKRDRVRGILLRAAARSAPSDAAVRETCLKALKGASAQLESSVLVAFGRLDPNSQVIQAVTPLLKDKNQNTRGLAVWVLGSQGTDECAKILQELLSVERTPEVTSMANAALKRCRKEKVEGYEDKYTTFFSDV